MFLLIAVLATVSQPFKYGSSVKLLTVYSFKENTDPYVTSKSNEYLSNLLSRIVYSNSFFEKVKKSGFNIDKTYFKGDDRKQMKIWAKTVKSRNVIGTGVIELDVYHTNREQAEQIARAITFIIQTEHSQYHGYGKNVEIKILDKPMTSKYPVKPNILLNLMLAISFGSMFAIVYIYFFPEEKHDIKILNRKKKTIIADKVDETQVDDNWSSTADIIEKNEIYKNYKANDGDIEEYIEPDDYRKRGNMSNILNK